MAIARRTFIKTGIAVATASLIGLRSKSGRAAGPPQAKRVLLFNAAGGMRNTAGFNASSKPIWNPWGVLGKSGVMNLGNLLVANTSTVGFAAPSWPGAPTVPGIRDAAPAFSLLGAVNHATIGNRAGDHNDEAPRMGTGYYGTGGPGLATLIWRHFFPTSPALPAVLIGSYGFFGYATGEWLPYKPMGIVPTGLPVGSALASPRSLPLEDVLDRGLRNHRNGLPGEGLDSYHSIKTAMRRYGPVLTQPSLHLNLTANLGAAVGGITNQMLLEAVGNVVTLTSTGDTEGLGVALAIRMLQMGSPVAVAGFGAFDYHSDEQTKAPLLYSRYARALAGIHFALSRIPDPSGTGSMLDSTLVVTTSEFDRCAEKPAGFNPGFGSGHAGGSSHFPSQPHVIFGAGIKPKLLAPTDDDNKATGTVYSTQALLSTIAQAVGVTPQETEAVWHPSSPLYPETGPLWEIWS